MLVSIGRGQSLVQASAPYLFVRLQDIPASEPVVGRVLRRHGRLVAENRILRIRLLDKAPRLFQPILHGLHVRLQALPAVTQRRAVASGIEQPVAVTILWMVCA